MKPGRNDPCPCGSGKKYKKCCQDKFEAQPVFQPLRQKAEAAAKGKAPTPDEINQLVALINAGRYGELESQERLTEAENIASGLTVRFPQHGFGWKGLGVVLQQQGRWAESLVPLQKAAELLPGDTEAHNNLGVIFRKQGLLTEAEASYRRALALKPDFAEAHNNLGNTLRDQGRLIEAEASCRRALALKPDLVMAHSNLGATLQGQGRLTEAEASCRRALALKPDFTEAHYNLGNILRDQGRLTEAEASLRRALALKPDYAEGHNNLGGSLQDQGRLTEAEASYRQALALKPDSAYAHSSLLFCLSRNEQVDAEALFAEHCRFGEQFEAPHRASWPQHTNSRIPDRCLQVGFVSGDLRDHAVAYFIEPVLAHLAGYPALSLHAYSNHVIEDSITQRLRGYVKHWHSIAGLSDAALAQKIQDDGIDILIDLSGHTANNRLLTFARKPAPVQARSWIGYPGTTGLSAMDYYLADRFFLPPGQFDGQFTEKIVHLPASVPFLPPAGAPPVNGLPALGNGYMTFGSFNWLNKLSPSVIRLWSQLLRALPNARMLLGGMPQDGKYDALIEWFAQEGIARERLSFHPRSVMQAYLALHHQVDICLDTFPYNGGTTTVHALWMGVPTLTLVGHTPSSGVGAAILGGMGLEAFVAQDATDFVEKGLNWAGDLASLASLRAGMRERFEQSAMGQPAVVAAGVERALRTMWQRWCAGLPAESFEVSLQESEPARVG